jgi:ribosomal protein S18 acetylase RimI-like enzyme
VLLDHLVVAARRDGIAQLELAVSVENPAAVFFYERSGFTIAGTIPLGFRHQGRDIDEHIMVRNLDA